MHSITRLLLAASLLCGGLMLSAQPSQEWSGSYGGEGFEEGQALALSPDGGFVMVGASSSPVSGTLVDTAYGSNDYLIVKVNSDSTIAWERRIGGDDNDVATEVLVDSRNQIIVAGRSRSRITGSKTTEVFGFQEIWVVAYDLSGELLWQQSYGGTGGEEPFAIVEADNGNLFIAARTDSQPHPSTPNRVDSLKGANSYWLFETTPTGDFIQEFIYGGDDIDQLWGMRKLNDGSLLLYGTSRSGQSLDKTSVGFGSSDMWLVRVNQQGVIQNQYTLGGDQAENPFFVTQFTDGDLFVSGQSTSGISGNKSTPALGALDLWCVRFDQNTGDVIWDRTFGGDQDDNAFTGSKNVNDYIVLAGNTRSANRGAFTDAIDGGDDGWLKYISPDGEEIWDITRGGNRRENIRGITRSEDGGWYLVGESNSDEFYWKNGPSRGTDFNMVRSNDIWYAKLECDFTVSLGVPDTNLCIGEEVILRNQDSDDDRLHTTFLWSDGSMGNSLAVSPTEDVDVFLESVSADACEASDTVSITVHAKPVVEELTVVDESCEGLNDGSIFFEASMDALNFEFDSVLYTAPQLFDNLTSGEYSFRVNSTIERCGFDTTVVLIPESGFSIDLGEDRDLILGDFVTLDANPTTDDPLTYTWSGISGLCNNCETQTIRLLESGTVTLIATNAQGCTSETQVTLTGTKDKLVGIPNALSPNNDGVNDRFAIFPTPFVERMGPMRIFDRWGNLVFVGIGAQLNLEEGWDGTNDGEPVQEGVYIYTLPVVYLDGEERIFKGEVHVVR